MLCSTTVLGHSWLMLRDHSLSNTGCMLTTWDSYVWTRWIRGLDLQTLFHTSTNLGLVMHETESGRAELSTLGCKLDCVNHQTRLTIGRRIKVGRAARELLRCRCVSVVIVEVVLGRAAFCCLTNRLTLSIFHRVH